MDNGLSPFRHGPKPASFQRLLLQLEQANETDHYLNGSQDTQGLRLHHRHLRRAAHRIHNEPHNHDKAVENTSASHDILDSARRNVVCLQVRILLGLLLDSRRQCWSIDYWSSRRSGSSILERDIETGGPRRVALQAGAQTAVQRRVLV